MVKTAFDKLDEFLTRLEAAGVFYRLGHVREGYVMVEVAVPGEHWEVEFASDGSVELEVFESSGDIQGPDDLDRLLSEHGLTP
jgi:hypothetical protein